VSSGCAACRAAQVPDRSRDVRPEQARVAEPRLRLVRRGRGALQQCNRGYPSGPTGGDGGVTCSSQDTVLATTTPAPTPAQQRSGSALRRVRAQRFELLRREDVKATPIDTSDDVKWAYSTGASSLAPPGSGRADRQRRRVRRRNDRVLHAMNPTLPAATGRGAGRRRTTARSGSDGDERAGAAPPGSRDVHWASDSPRGPSRATRERAFWLVGRLRRRRQRRRLRRRHRRATDYDNGENLEDESSSTTARLGILHTPTGPPRLTWMAQGSATPWPPPATSTATATTTSSSGRTGTPTKNPKREQSSSGTARRPAS